MQVVDDGLGQRDVQWLIILPIEIVFDDFASGYPRRRWFFSPDPRGVNMTCGVMEEDLLVVDQAICLFRHGPFDPVAVSQVIPVCFELDMPEITGPVDLRVQGCLLYTSPSPRDGLLSR